MKSSLLLTAVSAIMCLLALPARSEAATGSYVKTNLDGLSNSSITCMCQDSLGRLWVGTWDGVNVYDSHEFWVWMHNPSDPNTISNNIIRNIVEQKSGIMWVATDYGINRIDSRAGKISRFYLGYEHKTPSDEKTFSISVSRSSKVFCSAKGWGLAIYDEETDMMRAVNVPGFYTSGITGLFCLGDDRLLLAAEDGSASLIQYALSGSGQIEVTEKTELFKESGISAAFKCGTILYIVTSDNTLYCYDEESEEIIHKIRIPVKDKVMAIAPAGKDSAAIGFDSYGVYILDLESEEISREEALADMNILSLYSGTQGILWAGTDGQGLWALYDDPFKMEKMTYSQISSHKTHFPVRAFYKDRFSDLYVGTKGEGIFVLRDGKTVRTYCQSLGSSSVFALAEGPGGDILVGHDGPGIDIISGKTGKVSSLMPGKEKMFGSVYSFLEDRKNGCFWLGTFGYGLVKLELRQDGSGEYSIGNVRFYKRSLKDSLSITNNMVQPMVMEGDSILWIGTRGGLSRLDIRTDTFMNFTTATSDTSAISSNEILSLHFSRDSTLWIGTGYGLNRLVRHGDGYGFRGYTTETGLHNNTIHCIEETSDGKLWLSTNHGLSIFDPQTELFTNYYNNDKLQDNEYSDGAGYTDVNGIIYFGGINGFNWFNPDEIKARDFSPEVLISRVALIQDPDNDIMTGTGKITLKYNENFFNIHFTALEYINNSSCEYSYRLKGFNDDWVNTGTSNTASFTNVPPGKYCFQIKSTNGDKVWQENMTGLQIKVTPPWWKSIYAYIAYTLLAAATILAIQIAINIRMKEKHRLELEELKRKQLADTYEAKLRFFTNIAHEFTTPLTLICGPIEQIMNEFHLPAKVEKYHRIIYSNAERMLRLIQELIEFRKADTSNEKPVYSRVDITALLHGVLENFSEVNEEKQINVETEISREMTVVTDRNAMEKIVYNLVSNAYKYTPDGGWIQIKAECGENGLVLSVKNSGKGIKPEHRDLLFDRFVILDNYEYQASKGRIFRNGIGMALVNSLVKMLSGKITVDSEQGKYTMFTLTFPPVGEDMVTAAPAGAEDRPGPAMEQEPETCPELAPETDGDTGRKAASSGKKSVMIVDDERQIRDLVADILGKEYNVVQAENGKAAIEKLRLSLPDLIISDINMPEMNGMEFLKWLKDNPLTKFIPVVFLAFKTDIEDEVETYEMGSEVFIPKPFYPKHLKAVVHSILDSRSLLKDYYNSALSSTDLYDGCAVDSQDKKFLMDITSAIEENITDEELSQNWLCERLSISRMQLYRKLKGLTGQTPSEFIRTIKLEHAAHLLKTTRMTVQEVMFNSGFNNKSYFYREFSGKYRMSPKEFRKEDNPEKAQK